MLTILHKKKYSSINLLNFSSCKKSKLNNTQVYSPHTTKLALTPYLYLIKNFLESNKKLNCLFIRKHKQFNKGRYSRNRQIYRTGVYLCFYINIIVLYLVWFMCYKFFIKFSYLWWLSFVLPFSFIFSRSLKNNFFLKKECIFFIKSYGFWLLNSVFNKK